jgi:hypothetical protein
MPRQFGKYALTLIAFSGLIMGQSPGAEATGTIGGKSVKIKYSAPSVRGRQIFGDGGVLSRDSTYPVWRAGANAATTLQTDANLDIGGLNVPAGTYSLYVVVKDPDKWTLIVNKQTGQGGDTYPEGMDLGRVPMNMEKPKAPVETLKYTISGSGNTGKLQLEWENHVASVALRAK